MAQDQDTVTVKEAAEALEVSLSTVWRLLRSGALKSTSSRGRRLIYRRDVERRTRASSVKPLPLTAQSPFVRMMGAWRSGGQAQGPGSENKRALLYPR